MTTEILSRFKAPDIGTIFIIPERRPGVNGTHRYRVDAWLKTVDIPESDHWMDKILFEASYQREGKRFVFCTREDATHICGSGVSGCMEAIENIKIVGKVNWTKKIMADQREHAMWLIGRMVH